MKNIAYFMAISDLSVKDVLEFENFEWNIDEETNAKTTIKVSKTNNIANEDIVLLKREGSRDFLGTVQDITDEDYQSVVSIKHINNIFDRKLILTGESTIATSIEQFLADTILAEFCDSSDILGYPWLTVDNVTDTPINISVDTDDHGIYNFFTFMTNCSQNYNIVYKWYFNNEDGANSLYLEISKQTETPKLIDTTTDDVTNFEEIYDTDVLAKVTVKWGESNARKSFYLLNDRTITIDASNPNRVRGKVDVLYTEKMEDVTQTALNAFKGNSYKHYIKFSVRKKSKLFDVDNFFIGTPLKVRTKNGVVETYISAISDDGGAFLDIICGNMRIDFIDKLKKEKK